MDALVLMACSGTKMDVPAPAFDLYQGVMYETYRAHVKPDARPEVLILSALHGFVAPDQVLAPYDQKMTGVRADEMLGSLARFMEAVTWPVGVRRVFLAGGANYRKVMRAALSVNAPDAAVSECSGGIGMQRSQLGRYLQELQEPHPSVIGYHPNGTPLYESMDGFSVCDMVTVNYRSSPQKAERLGVIRQLFKGPGGPMADVQLVDGKPGKHESRWIGLADIQLYNERTEDAQCGTH